MRDEGSPAIRMPAVLRLVLMGTGPFAVPSFDALCAAGHDCLLVITRPERPGPGKKPAESSPVRKWADSRNLPVVSPESVNSLDTVQMLSLLKPDLLVVCDYGQILKPTVLATATLGGINLHGSLLPAYRGAAPVQWAVLNGDPETGVCIIHMTPRLDAGPLISVRKSIIGDKETAGELESRLSVLGIDATMDAIAELVKSRDLGIPIDAKPQDCELASKAPRLSKADGRILWTRTARELDFHVRGMQPWPGAFTEIPASTGSPSDGLRLMVLEIEPTGQAVGPDLVAGTVRVIEDELWVATGDQWIRLVRIKPAGKREMIAAEWLRGRPFQGTVVLR